VNGVVYYSKTITFDPSTAGCCNIWQRAVNIVVLKHIDFNKVLYQLYFLKDFI